MRSIYTERKKKKLQVTKEKMKFKRTGYDGLDIASRRLHEERVQKIYGRSTRDMSESVNERTATWVNKIGPILLEKNSQPQQVHRNLIPFRSKFDPSKSTVKHNQHYISIANDSLIPRKYLKGGGELDLEKSTILSNTLKNSIIKLTETKPLRLIQPQYRLPEYPLRERDPTRDIGPSGGSTGGMIYKRFSDQERKKHEKARPTLADNGQSPWNELSSRLAFMPVFRDKPNPKIFRSSTAPAGFHLTDLNVRRNNIPSSSALDEPWNGPLDPKVYAVHNDVPSKWSGYQNGQKNRFYNRSNIPINYQMTSIDRIIHGPSKTAKLLRKGGHINSSTNYEHLSSKNLKSTLILKNSNHMEWNDGSENKNLTLHMKRTINNATSNKRKKKLLHVGKYIGKRGYFASARACKSRSSNDGGSMTERGTNNHRVTPW